MCVMSRQGSVCTRHAYTQHNAHAHRQAHGPCMASVLARGGPCQELEFLLYLFGRPRHTLDYEQERVAIYRCHGIEAHWNRYVAIYIYYVSTYIFIYDELQYADFMESKLTCMCVYLTHLLSLHCIARVRFFT